MCPGFIFQSNGLTASTPPDALPPGLRLSDMKRDDEGSR